VGAASVSGGRLRGAHAAGAAEGVDVEVAQGCGDRQGEDRAQESRDCPAQDEREDDHGGVELRGVALDLRNEEGVLDLLDREVEGERGDDPRQPGRRAEEDGRDRRDDGADDRQQLEYPGDHREQDRVAGEDRVHDGAEHEEADEGRRPDDEAEDQLAADPGPEDAAHDPECRPRVGAPLRRDRVIEGSHDPRAVPQDPEGPDRDDQVPEDRAGEPEDRAEDRAKDGGDDRPDIGEEIGHRLVDGRLDVSRQVETVPPPEQLGEACVEVVDVARGVPGEGADLLDQGPDEKEDELEEDERRDEVDQEDEEGPRDPPAADLDPGQALHHRIEQVDDEDPDDERGQHLPAEPENDREDRDAGEEDQQPARRNRDGPGAAGGGCWRAGCGRSGGQLHPSGRLPP
jgi:hypothetical protein